MKTLKKLVFTALVLAVALSVMAVPAFADEGVIAWGAATVDVDLLNVRSEPNTESTRLSVLSRDTIVVVIEKTNDEWYKINYLGTEGYVACEYLRDILEAENFKATGTVTGDDVRMRKSHSTDSAVMAAYDTGTTVSIIGINHGWYKIVTAAGGGPTFTSDTRDTAASSSLGQQIANYALQFEGYKYVYGEESPSKGFDCSGLTYYVYGQFGYKLERRASLQCKNNGRFISRSELQPGDLVFFSTNGSYATHVGIYIGNNQYIHASTAKTGVKISTLNEYFAAKRII